MPFFFRKATHLPTDAMMYARPAFDDPKANLLKVYYDDLEHCVAEFHRRGQVIMGLNCASCKRRVVYGTVSRLNCGGAPSGEWDFKDMAHSEKIKMCGSLFKQQKVELIPTRIQVTKSVKDPDEPQKNKG